VEQLVGREAELDAVHEALVKPAGRGMVLEGEPGIGKTALWYEGITEAGRRGMQVLVARPVEAETRFSHAALADLLTPVMDELPGDMPAPQRHALEVALLRAAADGESVDQRAVGAATLAALRSAAAREPLVLAVDDVQWLDTASAAALRFALRRLFDAPLVFLATRRANGVRGSLDVGLADERVTRVTVGPLDAAALERMLRRDLGDTLPRPVLKRVAEISGGNPYFALELGRAALRRGDTGRSGGEIPLPEGLHAVLQDRLEALPSDTSEALGAVAAMGVPTMAMVRQALDDGALDAAFAAGILLEEGEVVRFEHPLLAEVAYRMLPPSRRRVLHERLAGITTDAEERARHLAVCRAGVDASVASDIERGAEIAAGRGARAAAAELLEASARVEPEAELAAARRIAAVRHHIAAGDARRAGEVGRALVDELPPGPLRSRALLALAEVDAEVDEMLRLVKMAVAEAGDDREQLIETLLLEGALQVEAGRERDAEEPLLRAKDLCEPDDSRALRSRVLTEYGFLLHSQGDPDGIGLLRDAAELEGDDVIPNASWGGGAVLGIAHLYRDELDDARSVLEPRYRRALEEGDDESVSSLSLYLAEIEIRAGRLDAALRYGEEGLAIQRASYGEDSKGSLAYGPAVVAAYRGQVELARATGEQGLAQTEASGAVTCASAIRTGLGFLEFSLGNNEEAVERFRPVVESFRDGEPGDPGKRHNVALPDAIEALTALGRLDEAEELVPLWERTGEQSGLSRTAATAARCRAVIAAARGNQDEALAYAEKALALHRDLPLPFQRARTLIVLGTLHRRAKHKAAARAALEEAVEILDGMGAALWAERARAELGRIGGRAATDGLTPTEQRVADLVAEGRSNKEVAAELFVSVRTVEANLTRVYQKLGIRSRTELAAIRQASDGRSRSPAPPPAPLS
jgi:DNA-binding CsgD family transcriptional regulator